MKKNVSNVLRKIVKIIFSIVITYLIISISIQKKSILFTYTPIKVILLSLIMVTILYFIHYIINKREIKHKKIIIVSIFFIIMILQLVVAILYKVEPDWRDLKTIFREAKDFDNSYDSKEYFCRCNNNIPILMFFKIIFRICNFIGLNCFIEIGILVNMIMIDASILLIYLIVKKYIGFKQALMALILIMIMPTTYLYIPVFYTDTITMLFPILMLYLYLKIRDEKLIKKKVLLSIMLGMVTFIGFTLKFTVIIIGIAICILEIFLKLKDKAKIKKICMCISVSLLTIVLLVCAKNFLLKNYFEYYDEMQDKKLPYTHYIMISLQGDGRYSEDDVQYTTSFDTYKEKVDANIEEIKNRINTHNENNDWAKFIDTKIRTTWGDGTFYIPWLLNRKPVNESVLHEFVLKNGEHTELYKYYSQALYIAMLVLWIMSLINIKKDNENEDDISSISQLTILGLIIIFTIWEAKSRYIVNYMPIFIILETIGIQKFYNRIRLLLHKK